MRIKINQKRFTQRRSFWALQLQKNNRERRAVVVTESSQISGEGGTAIIGEQNEPITS